MHNIEKQTAINSVLSARKTKEYEKKTREKYRSESKDSNRVLAKTVQASMYMYHTHTIYTQYEE